MRVSKYGETIIVQTDDEGRLLCPWHPGEVMNQNGDEWTCPVGDAAMAQLRKVLAPVVARTIADAVGERLDSADEWPVLPSFLVTLPCGCLVGSDTPVATYLALARLVKAHECPAVRHAGGMSGS